MLLPSEIEAKSIIPAIRCIIARTLVSSYDLKEEEVAKLIGTTQAAVSNYVRGARGDTKLMLRLLTDETISNSIENIVKELDKKKSYTPYIMNEFIKLCNYMRQSLIICEVHHKLESKIDKNACKICELTLSI